MKSGDKTGAEQVGQYGTGFMTTHAFNRTVYISGPFEVKKGKDEIVGYVQIHDFELNRTSVDTEKGPEIMREQLESVRELCHGYITSNMNDDTTSFRYELTSSQVNDISCQLSNALRLMPFVLVINNSIKEVEIINHQKGEHLTLTKDDPSVSSLDADGWNLVENRIRITRHGKAQDDVVTICKSLQSKKGDVIIVPPYPDCCNNINSIPSLFLWFPLLGTEDYGVNFIFHSKRFYPVEKRNSIMLPGSTPVKMEKGRANEGVLKEMTDVLMNFYSQDENASNLSRELCKVSSRHQCEDKETCRFYEEMQVLWSKHIQNWKVIPIDGKCHAISEDGVRLLHRDFYSKLEPEQKKEYESIIAKYALLPKKADGSSYLMPTSDLIGWSEMVDSWDCHRDNEFFITVSDVCQAIRENGENLHSFLTMMKDGGNGKVVEEYPLLPNRQGDLRRKNELCNAAFMSVDIYNLVKILMGDDSTKIIDSSFLDICEVNTYSSEDLQRAISATLGNWRMVLNRKETLTNEQLTSLVNFCSAFSDAETRSIRRRMMPLLTRFWGEEFKVIPIIRFKTENEEEFYASAFNLLLDYTLLTLSQKNADWVKDNVNWLRQFIEEYTPLTNESHDKRLDDYGVLPNQSGFLCLKKDLSKNEGVPSELADIYKEVFEKDLHDSWIAEDFENLVKLNSTKPKEISREIETCLVEDMKQDCHSRKFDKVVRAIILKIGDSEDWADWFGQINEKKATYTFSMKSGDAQKSLFSLMDMEDCSLERLAKLNELGNIESMLDKLERQQEIQQESEARFHHLHAIGKHIESVMRKTLDAALVKVDIPNTTDVSSMVEDDQNGQDIIVYVREKNEWKDIYRIEVKSKWDFSEPAHMSANQMRTAVLNPDHYALCCVDLREHKDENLAELPDDVIIGCTRVKTDIGEILGPMIKAILKADDSSDDEQIKISGYRSNMGAKFFSKGETFDFLLNKIVAITRCYIHHNGTQSIS